jgi:Methyltransferase domain
MQISIPLIRRLADDENTNSLANRLRQRRFQLFEAFVARLPRPLKILDVGGTNDFWERRGWADCEDFQITTLNLFAEEKRHGNIEPIAGDATNLAGFADKSFDVVFSNSVIEHLFTLENQRRMANEIQRVGKAYWVQTPNFWFPIEPHFHVPGWQWLPVAARVATIRRWRCGWRGPCSDPAQARQLVTEVRLLRGRELAQLFPGAEIVAERFGGLVKSWTAVGGLPKAGLTRGQS